MGKKSKSKKASPHRWERNVPSKPSQDRQSISIDFWWLLPALVLGFLVYFNTLNGEFVYDDLRQIVRNTLIQDGSRFWQAMTSDVWAFKGGEEAVSNYWRPSFVFWMILNFRCFGLQTFGWHLTNILLHVGVVALVFALSRRLGLSRPIAAAIALIFAVHPVHSESVAWISGAPDLILAAALLGSIWFVDLLSEKPTPFRWALAIALYVIALGAKEVAILFPLVIVALLLPNGDQDGKRASPARPLSITWPFLGVAIIYLIARYAVLGTTQRLPDGAATLGQTILTAPAGFAFYLRQMIVPYWIGPSYPMRAVADVNIGMMNFVIPLIVSVAAGCWMIWMASRSKTARIGLAIFLVPLLPTFNIAVFHPEQLVHDRYLYLPLLGFLLLTIPAIASLFQRIASAQTSQAGLAVFIIVAVFAIPLGAQTVRYNRAWTSNLALWEWGVQSDPNSAYNYQQYAVQLHQARRRDEAVRAFDRSNEIHPMPTTYVSRATTLIDLNRFAEAERDLREVTSKEVAQVSGYTMYQAYERLAILKTQERKVNEAVDAITEGRRRLPQYRAALTEKLAIILYQGGDKQRAVDELNAVQVQARTETLPESRLVFYRLGLLNTELGHPQEARAAFQEFMSLTQNMGTPEISRARTHTESELRKPSR